MSDTKIVSKYEKYDPTTGLLTPFDPNEGWQSFRDTIHMLVKRSYEKIPLEEWEAMFNETKHE